jgi:hypothetical protein
MSNIFMTLAAFATGLASVAAIAGYHLLLPSPGVAFSSTGFAVDEKNPEPPVKARSSRRRHQIVDTLLRLDDHLLRDIGVTRGIMVSIKSADGRPRGLYADMISERLRRF